MTSKQAICLDTKFVLFVELEKVPYVIHVNST